MAFMPENAPLVVLSFLGTCFVVSVGLVCFVVAVLFRWPKVCRATLAATGMRALQQSMGQVVPMTQPLRPGESFVTYLLFELPKDTKTPRLLITDRDPIAHFLINHEESFFHKKIFFQLSRVDAPSTALLGPLPPPCGCRRGPD